MTRTTFFKSRYYPVNVDAKVIVDDPHKREIDCSCYNGYRGKHTIGIKGERLNEFACYRAYRVVDSIQEASA